VGAASLRRQTDRLLADVERLRAMVPPKPPPQRTLGELGDQVLVALATELFGIVEADAAEQAERIARYQQGDYPTEGERRHRPDPRWVLALTRKCYRRLELAEGNADPIPPPMVVPEPVVAASESVPTGPDVPYRGPLVVNEGGLRVLAAGSPRDDDSRAVLEAGVRQAEEAARRRAEEQPRPLQHRGARVVLRDG
jgi:hypothetical protein